MQQVDDDMDIDQGNQDPVSNWNYLRKKISVKTDLFYRISITIIMEMEIKICLWSVEWNALES